MSDSRRGIRAAQAGILINAALAGTKLVAGIVGNTYALVADAVESMADIFGSLIVWGGLHVASLPADEEHPFGHGKAEALAAMCVSLMLLAAAAFVGISIALLGSRYAGGTGWASADDWAALVASAVIAFNGVSTVHAAMHDLMDRMPGQAIVAPIRAAALGVAGVSAIEKLHVRKAGTAYRVTIHVQADGAMSLDAAHALGGRVKRAICASSPQVNYVLVHMEPWAAPGELDR